METVAPPRPSARWRAGGARGVAGTPIDHRPRFRVSRHTDAEDASASPGQEALSGREVFAPVIVLELDLFSIDFVFFGSAIIGNMSDRNKAFNPTLLRLARERVGMTQRALATHVSAGEGEITQAAISKYESGKTIPTRPVLKALAKAVGILPESFWQGYEEAASEMPHHRKFSALSAKFRMQDVVTLLHADNRDVPSPEDLDGWREAISSLPPTEAAQGPLHPLCACVESLGRVVFCRELWHKYGHGQRHNTFCLPSA